MSNYGIKKKIIDIIHGITAIIIANILSFIIVGF